MAAEAKKKNIFLPLGQFLRKCGFVLADRMGQEIAVLDPGVEAIGLLLPELNARYRIRKKIARIFPGIRPRRRLVATLWLVDPLIPKSKAWVLEIHGRENYEFMERVADRLVRFLSREYIRLLVRKNQHPRREC